MTSQDWETFSKRYRRVFSHNNVMQSEDLAFYACLDRDGAWFDSSESFSIALHWCRYYAGDFSDEISDSQWMNEDGKKQGYSVVHGTMLKKMWEKGLVS
jgi:hypothetical protein